MTNLGELKMSQDLILRIAKAKKAVDAFEQRDGPVDIRVYPDPILTSTAEPIDFDKDSFEDILLIVKKMARALQATTWGSKLGIAAPQIGISKRVMIVNGAVMVNPKWKPVKTQRVNVTESCYSLPHRRFLVERPKYGWAKWYSIDGAVRQYKLKGMDAIVFMHEISHLDGLCAIDLGKELIEDGRTQSGDIITHDEDNYEDTVQETSGEGESLETKAG